MPSSLHPQAKFDPIPPDLDLSALVEKTSNFDYVIRISTDQIRELGLHEFEKLVLLHVIIGGKPLVVEGWNRSLPPWLFSSAWLEDNMGKKRENVRDIGNGTDMPMTIGHYLNAMEKLTKQWTPSNFRDIKRQRLYLKDIDCPDAWHQHLQSIIPQTLFYLNECAGETGGPGAMHERNIYDQLVLGKGVGAAGDLMSNLPPEMRAENMMCYIGHEGTYTPTHREMCASLGQNIMVETSSAQSGERPGSSVWFMTESKDREVVSEYFLSMLGHDIEVESHFAQVNAWKKAPFPVYIVEQKLGDFILIPPLAPHQVWNRGTRTMKVAWNRTTVDTLELALHEALPRARMVCRDEQYKCKAIVYYSLVRYYDQLKRVEQAEDASWDGNVKESIRNDVRVKQLKRDFRRLFALFTEILVSEMFSPDLPKEKNVEFLPFDSNVTCSYCRCNIFNRFLTCKTCIDVIEDSGEEDTYDVCMECYALGRSCGCLSNLTWVEQWQWPELTQHYENWRVMVIGNNGYIDIEFPQTLEIARMQYNKKTIAQICQEQLRRRPWRDISNPGAEHRSSRFEASPEIDNEGYAKRKRPIKRKGRRQGSQKDSRSTCHICKTSDWTWRLAFCSTCTSAYCYGTLWRAFDLEPQTVMENANWQCPKCLNICSCGKCRRDPSQQPYRPKGTLLGHDTRRVADPRSVESLVDFGRANLFWLRDDGDNDPQTSLRMQKLMEKAQNEKARDETLDEEMVGEENTMQMADTMASNDHGHEMAIDPQLQDLQSEIIVQPHDTQSVQNVISSEGLSTRRQFNGEDQSGGPTIEQLDGNERANVPLENQGHLSYRSPYPLRDNSTATASILIPDLPYLDTSAPIRDRMMGMGYYQQANDPDKILFDHPDISTLTDQESTVAYPRLLVEEPDHGTSTSKKRKGGSTSTLDTREVDAAHLEFYQAQKKQKLADAKKNGTYFMTRNLLGGGGSLTVKLPMHMSKKFLQNLEEMSTGQIEPSHDRISPQRRPASQEHHSENEDSTIIVRSDIQDMVTHSSRGDGEDQEDGVALATRAMRKLRMPPALSTLASNAKLPKPKRKPGRPKKTHGNAFDDNFTASLATKLSETGHPASPILQSSSERRKALDNQPWITVNRQSRSHKIQDDKPIAASLSDRKSRSSHSPLPHTPSATQEPIQRSLPSLVIVADLHTSSSQNSSPIMTVSRAFPNNSSEKTSNDLTEKTAKFSQEEASISLPRKVGKDMTEKAFHEPIREPIQTFLEEDPMNLPNKIFTDPPTEATEFSPKATPIALPKKASESLPKNALKAGSNRESLKTSEQDANSSSPSNALLRGEEDFVLVDDNYRPISTSLGATTKSTTSRLKLYISEDYLAAKEQALRMVEATMEKDSSNGQRPEKHRKSSVPVRQLVKSGRTLTHTKSPTVVVKSLPKAPPGTLLSMAERQALRGKSFKIVSARSTPTRKSAITPTAISATKPLVFKQKSTITPTVAIRQNSSSPSEDSSKVVSTSDSDDDSIPAIRPIAKKPRLETFTNYNDESKVNAKHTSRRLGNIQGGKSLFRSVK